MADLSLVHTRGLPAGLGGLATLSDELLLGVLGHVGARGLVACASASKALHCFATHEELWRAMTLQARQRKTWHSMAPRKASVTRTAGV